MREVQAARWPFSADYRWRGKWEEAAKPSFIRPMIIRSAAIIKMGVWQVALEGSMSMKRFALYMVAVLAVVQIMPVFAEDTSPAETVQAVVGADGKQRVEVLGGSYFFKPDHIIVKVNVPVVLSIRREWGIVPHTFVLKMPDSGVMIDESLSTDPKTVEFTPKVTGKYTFYCRNKFLFFKSHEEKGMKGILEVIP
jgi:plastocyanin